MSDIIEHARAAVIWLHDNEAAGNFERSRIHVAGHSAGGHLAAELLATDWQAHGLPADAVKGVTAISGVYDLAPLIETSINDELRLDQDLQYYAREAVCHRDHCRIDNGFPYLLVVGAAPGHPVSRE